MSIATVVSISGQAWARDADGNMRELRVGDTLAEGESLITSDNGRVELDFADNLDPTVIEGGQVVAMTPELDADLPVDSGEFSALDEDLEALLAALDDDDIDLLDVLDATAAGAGPGGGADGGHSFVQLARIAETVDPLAFEFGMGEFGGPPETEGAGLLLAEAEEELELISEPELEPEPLPPGTITVSIENINSENVTQVPITGTTSNVPVGSTITIVVTDQEGNTATTESTVNPDGSYQAEIDLSNLVDGPVSVDASVVDQTGETQTADDDAVKDTFAEASITIDTIAGDDVINGEEATQTITITGTVGGDAREGDTVTLIVGGQEFTGLVGEDLTYAIDVPGSLLAEHDSVTAEVTGSDDAGNPYSADTDRDYGVNLSAEASITIDTIAGDDVINGEEATQTITITGTVGDDAREGDTVTLIVGGQEFTGLVGEDLTYAIDVPGSLLADNDNVQAEVTGSDDTGNPYSAEAERPYGVAAPEITGLNSSEADLVVDEQYLQNGSNPNLRELVKSGTFGINAVAGIAHITVAGQTITIDDLMALDGAAPAIEITTSEGNIIRITGYEGNASSGTVSYEFQLVESVLHPEGDGRNPLNKEGIEVSVTDERNQEASSSIDVTIIDDVPSDFTPETGSLDDGFVGSIGFEANAGADGVGNVEFTVRAGTPATDINGLQLFLDGEPLYYQYEGDDHSVLYASTADGDPGFKIVLDSDSDTYTITTYGKILNGTEFSGIATGGVSGGNSSVYGLNLNDGVDSNDVLVSTRAGETVNTSVGNGIGVSNGNSISNGEMARFDFVASLSLGGSGASWSDSLDVTRFAQEVSVRGGSSNTAILTIKALSDVSATSIVSNGTIEGNGTYLQLSVDDIRVYDTNGADVTSSLTITQSGVGIQIAGIKSGYTYELNTDSPFQAVEVIGGNGANFNLGDFTYFQGGTATDIELNLPIQGVDGDGDTVDSSLEISAPVESVLYVGGNGDNTFESTSGDDIIIGDIGGKVTIVEPGQDYNISLIVDVSGSMNEPSGSGDLSLMQLAKEALINLADQLKDHDGAINVQLVVFSTHAESSVTIQNLNNENVHELMMAIDALSADGGTNYQAAFEKAVAWFNEQEGLGLSLGGGYKNLTYFLTDGDPTLDYRTDNGNESGPGDATSYTVLQNSVISFSELAALSQIEAIGIGNDASEQYLQFFTNTGAEVGEVSVSIDGFRAWGWLDGVEGIYNWGAGTVTADAGDVSIVNTAEDLSAALAGGTESDELAPLGDDVLVGEAGDDIIFGDTINTDHLAWTNGNTGDVYLAHQHDGMGFVGLVEYLTWAVNEGEGPSSQQIKEHVRENWESLIDTTREDGGNNIMDGGAGNDILIGGTGDDTLIGGAGDDILFGGAGADTFVWNLGDQGMDGNAAVDTVMDFTQGAFGTDDQADRLALASLLPDADATNFADYISAEEDGEGNVILKISSGGEGTYVDQEIILKDVAFASGQDGTQFIQQLLDHDQLHID